MIKLIMGKTTVLQGKLKKRQDNAYVEVKTGKNSFLLNRVSNIIGGRGYSHKDRIDEVGVAINDFYEMGGELGTKDIRNLYGMVHAEQKYVTDRKDKIVNSDDVLSAIGDLKYGLRTELEGVKADANKRSRDLEDKVGTKSVRQNAVAKNVYAPKGVPSAQMASAYADKVGNNGRLEVRVGPESKHCRMAGGALTNAVVTGAVILGIAASSVFGIGKYDKTKALDDAPNKPGVVSTDTGLESEVVAIGTVGETVDMRKYASTSDPSNFVGPRLPEKYVAPVDEEKIANKHILRVIEEKAPGKYVLRVVEDSARADVVQEAKAYAAQKPVEAPLVKSKLEEVAAAASTWIEDCDDGAVDNKTQGAVVEGAKRPVYYDYEFGEHPAARKAVADEKWNNGDKVGGAVTRAESGLAYVNDAVEFGVVRPVFGTVGGLSRSVEKARILEKGVGVIGGVSRSVEKARILERVVNLFGIKKPLRDAIKKDNPNENNFETGFNQAYESLTKNHNDDPNEDVFGVGYRGGADVAAFVMDGTVGGEGFDGLHSDVLSLNPVEGVKKIYDRESSTLNGHLKMGEIIAHYIFPWNWGKDKGSSGSGSDGGLTRTGGSNGGLTRQ